MTPPHQYRFGIDKVHPLNAPWSSPRGYTTSILEEVAAYKASLPTRQKPKPKPIKTISVDRRSSGNQFFRRLWTSIRNHFIALGQDINPRQTSENPDGDVKIPRPLVILCCLKI